MPYNVSYTMNAWLRVTLAVVKIGSSEVRLACGTMRSTLDAACAAAGSAKVPASPAMTDRRRMPCPAPCLVA